MSFNGDLYPTAGADVVMTTSGDMVKYESGARKRLGIGSANQILQVKSSLPSWETLSTAGSVLTTQGDVLIEGAAGLERLGQSTDGFVLTTKGASANPVWAASSGDMLLGTSQNITASKTFNDSVDCYFGTGNDAKILHDGVNMYIEVSTGSEIHSSNVYFSSGYSLALNRADATISSGLITGTSNTMVVDTEGAAATDDLDSANFTSSDITGAYFSLISANNSRDITVKDQAVSPFFLMPSDYTLDTTQDILYFAAVTNFSHNYEISRSNNS